MDEDGEKKKLGSMKEEIQKHVKAANDLLDKAKKEESDAEALKEVFKQENLSQK